MIELIKVVMIVQVSVTCRASDKSLLLPPSGNSCDFWTGTNGLEAKGALEAWKVKRTLGLDC